MDFSCRHPFEVVSCSNSEKSGVYLTYTVLCDSIVQCSISQPFQRDAFSKLLKGRTSALPLSYTCARSFTFSLSNQNKAVFSLVPRPSAGASPLSKTSGTCPDHSAICLFCSFYGRVPSVLPYPSINRDRYGNEKIVKGEGYCTFCSDLVALWAQEWTSSGH